LGLTEISLLAIDEVAYCTEEIYKTKWAYSWRQVSF
jgi:hypothetical protein